MEFISIDGFQLITAQELHGLIAQNWRAGQTDGAGNPLSWVVTANPATMVLRVENSATGRVEFLSGSLVKKLFIVALKPTQSVEAPVEAPKKTLKSKVTTK